MFLECGKKRTSATPLIVGGTEAEKYEFPWVAAIYTEGSKLCAGSIISPYHVLTGTTSSDNAIQKYFNS